MELKPITQKAGQAWTDETGVSVPFNRISGVEIVKEQYSAKLLKEAITINSRLQSFMEMITDANEKLNSVIDAENKKLDKKVKPTKGNFTWFNFDRSIKVEVSIQESIKFDDAKIASAREKFDAFIERNVQGTDDIVRQLINSAFANTRGGLDPKKVLSLLKFRSKIKDKGFQTALDLIEESISRPTSKRYFRVWCKGEDGQYQNIDLNFSSI